MIRHCVFVKYRAGVTRAERDAIYASLELLISKIPGMLSVEFGPNVSPEGLGKGFDEGFFVEFNDAKARDAYLVDPDHQAIGARIVGLADGGVDGILVFDLDIG
jgi:hypothetical protein